MAKFDTLLKGKLTPSELKQLKTSLDIFGEIAVVEIPEELAKKQSIIGKAILKANTQLRAVFKKASAVKGEFRTRELTRIAGTGDTLTTYRENGCDYKFDIAKVFFTPRMSTERLRVAKQVSANEIVVDMFSGVGPFAILIAKTQPQVERIYTIDSNPDAIAYLQESAAMNKISHKISAFTGDARMVIKNHLKGIADRVIMNLPKTEEHFFDSALLALKSKGYLHFYTFTQTEEEVHSKIDEGLNCDYQILKIRKVRPYAPRIWNFAADIKVKRKVNK